MPLISQPEMRTGQEVGRCLAPNVPDSTGTQGRPPGHNVYGDPARSIGVWVEQL